MATAGYSSKLYVTTTDTNPSSSDLIGGIQSTTFAPSRAELDTGILGETFTSLSLGKTTNAPAITALYIPADTGQARFIAAWSSGNTVWLHFDALGSGSCAKIGVKVSAYSVKSDQGGLVTVDFTLKSATAPGTSTAS